MISWIHHFRYLARQRGFLGFLGVVCCLGVALSFVLPFLSLWGTEPGRFSLFQFGLFMAALSLSGVILGTLFGRASDGRISRKAVLLSGSACGVLGYTGFAFIVHPWVLFGVAVTLAAMASVCFSQIFATAREWLGHGNGEANQAALTVSVVRICFSLAWIVGPMLAGAIVNRGGYEALFLATAFLYLIVFLGVLKFVPRCLSPISQSASAQKIPMRQTLRRPVVFTTLAALTLISAGMTATNMALPLALMAEFDGTPLQVGFVFGVGPFVEVPFMLWFGQLAARGRGAMLMRLGGFVALLYFFLLFSATTVFQICVIQLLAGISTAVLGNVAIISLQNLIPHQPGLATALFANSGSVGKLIGYFSFGLTLTWLETRGVFGLSAVAAAVSCGLLLFVYRDGRKVAGEMAGPKAE